MRELTLEEEMAHRNAPIVAYPRAFPFPRPRADRWYKLGRTILYGRLEDEAPFKSVARLVQYEDYALRVMRDAGIPTATPYGIVEITPGREYILVTSFFEGAEEIDFAARGRADKERGEATGVTSPRCTSLCRSVCPERANGRPAQQ